MFEIGVITLIPEIFQALHYGIVGRALAQGIARVTCFNPRDWGLGVHRQVDDKSYGGGPGMVMMYEPLAQAIRCAKAQLLGCKVIYLSPQGQPCRQGLFNTVVESKQPLLFVAGRYEGIDERVIDAFVDEEWSLGDFVLSGGEFAALAFIDAIVRLLPGSLGQSESADQDSFMDGLLDYPHYTRPALIEGRAVPDVLLSGDHFAIKRWRRQQALGKTDLKRFDLLQKIDLSEEDRKLLELFKLTGVKP